MRKVYPVISYALFGVGSVLLGARALSTGDDTLLVASACFLTGTLIMVIDTVWSPE